MYDNDTFEHDGKTFRVTMPADDSGDAPWDREDGHGPVSDWTTRDKRPGERVLCVDRYQKRFYDFAEAVRMARRDGWGAEGSTPGERAARAAEADYDNLRRWCNDEWTYVGVVVELLDDDGDLTGDTASLWGIESDDREYIDVVARELADEILAEAASLCPCG